MWCPKCGIEYQEGIAVCAECGSDLVDGDEDDFLTVDLCEFKDESAADELIKYLSFSGIEKAAKNPDDGIFVITVPKREAKKAEKLLRGFVIAMEEDEKKRRESGVKEVLDEDADDVFFDENEDEIPEDVLFEKNKTYTKKSDEYRDAKFSGMLFVIFGIAGAAYLFMCKSGILPIDYANFVFVGLACIFAAFVVGGAATLVKSRRLREQIAQEEDMTAQIKEWIEKNITKESILEWRDESASDAENDLIASARLRRELIKNYKDLDPSYLEMVADEYYGEKFS